MPLSVPSGFTDVTASRLITGGGVLVSNATAVFTPRGQFQVGGSGQVVADTISAAVSNGYLEVALADGSLSNPQFVGYTLQIVDNVSGQTLMDYGAVQPQGASWSLDTMVPAGPGYAIRVAGLQGVPGTPGQGLNWKGSYNAANTYAPGDAVYNNGTGYVALQASSSSAAQAPGNAAYWGQLIGTLDLDIRTFGASTSLADNAAAINAACNAARANGLSVYIPAGTFNISTTIDMRGLSVRGAGMNTSVLAMQSGVQKSVILISLNTFVRDFYVKGGWDRKTANGNGYGIEATSSDPSVSQLAYNMQIRGMHVSDCFASCVYLPCAAYTLVEGCDMHATGGRAVVDIDSHDDNGATSGFGATTITLLHNTLSDTLGGTAPSIYINDGVNIRVIACTLENTGCIQVVGPANRSLSFISCYVENASSNAGRFLNMVGSGGIGLLVQGNRAGITSGPTHSDIAAWQNWHSEPNWFANGDIGSSAFPLTTVPTSSFFDPVGSHAQEFIFTSSGPTQIGSLTYTAGAQWAAIIRASHVDFAGGSAATPFTVVTSAAPTASFNGNGVTFSLSSSGVFQGQATGNGVRLLGTVEVFTDKNHGGAPPYALATGAPIHVGGVTSDGPITASSIVPANGWSGSYAAGTKTVTVTNGIITNVQ